jgi:hypothetical protein
MKNLIAWLLEPFYRKTFLPWLGAVGFILYGGKDGGDAPDYDKLAAASEKAAELGYELGQDQLDENKRQYDQNYAVAAPIIQAQTGLTNQQIQQGNDYYSYMQQFSRPVEMSLFYDAMGFTPQEVEQLNAAQQAATTAGNAKVESDYTAAMQKYNQDVEAAKQGAYFVDNQGRTIQADQVGKVLPPTQIPSTQQQQPNLFNNPLGGLNGLTGIGFQRPVQLTEEQKTAQEMQSKGYFQVQTKDGDTVWVQSGATNANPAASTIQKPVKGTAQYDYTEANKLAAQLGMTAAERVKQQQQAERDVITNKSNELATRIGETNTQVYNRYKDDIEAEAGQAVADSRAGFTNAVNVAARQGLRYGFSPAKIAAMAGTQSVDQAAKQAAAANVTRKGATETMFGRGVGSAQQVLQGVTSARSMKQQDEALTTAKKLDTAGLYRGLPGASQGAYNTAINAGNAAVNNQNSTSALYMNGMNQGNNTIMQGQQQKLNGLGNILQSQTSVANSGDNGSAIWGALGTVGGAALSVMSDEDVKKDIKDVDEDKALDGVKKLDVKEWKYDASKVEGQDDRRHTGAMAQDMKKNLGETVSNGRMVDLISAIGVNMAATKALAKKVEKLEGVAA